MGETYAYISGSLNRNGFGRVIVTDEKGVGESVIMSMVEYDAMKETAWDQYVSHALAEVEAVKDKPETWLNADEFWNENF